jgi:hypothetical protein
MTMAKVTYSDEELRWLARALQESNEKRPRLQTGPCGCGTFIMATLTLAMLIMGGITCLR